MLGVEPLLHLTLDLGVLLRLRLLLATRREKCERDGERNESELVHGKV